MSDSSHVPPRSPGPAEAPPAPADLAEARELYAQLDPAWFDGDGDPERWLFEPEIEALVQAVLDEVLEAWRRSLTPEGLAALREELEAACYSDRVLIEYLRRLRPAPERDQSGKVGKAELARLVGSRASKKAGGSR